MEIAIKGYRASRNRIINIRRLLQAYEDGVPIKHLEKRFEISHVTIERIIRESRKSVK